VCTLAVAFQVYPQHPLVVAANRDERLTRPSAPPRLWPGPPPFVAPVDEVAQGTWVGLNRHGLFVGITNRYGGPADPARASRGELVTRALGGRSAQQVQRALKGLGPLRYNAFHLFFADAHAAYLVWSDGEQVTQQALPPGLHVLTERSLGAAEDRRSEEVRARWPALTGATPPPRALGELLAVHAEDPLAGTCVHADALGYGTRSSLLLFAGADPARATLLWAEGKPCQVPHQPRSALLEALGAADGA
jgi:hypothetical protein